MPRKKSGEPAEKGKPVEKAPGAAGKDAQDTPPKRRSKPASKAPLLAEITEAPAPLGYSAEAGGQAEPPEGRARPATPLIVTDLEATIPVIIPPGARSPVDDIVEVLHREVIGQERAIEAIARALLRSREGFRTPGRPISVMFFAGPTGVGKTETVRALARALHNDHRAVLKVDCSEYSEPHSIARLVGASRLCGQRPAGCLQRGTWRV
jgi:Cdc6-like AAA superfamily ATPase